MSGTSLDGLDIAYCHFTKGDSRWEYTLEKCAVIKYPEKWLSRLKQIKKLSAEDLIRLDVELGKYLGKVTKNFIVKHKLEVDFIASHGHTLFHQPDAGFTYQAGNGNAICATVGIPVISDFRSLDVMLGGEGAPLVPAGDKYLFKDYDICLNLGGIANLSLEVNAERKAYDICFCNMSLNYLIEKTGKAFDKGGILASQGEVNIDMMKQFDRLYKTLRKRRPSLGREMFEKQIKPILDQKKISLQDKLATSVESTAAEIATALLADGKESVLCTGGGAYNAYLMSRILYHVKDQIALIIPEDDVVKFKEALVFAFLGVLKVENQINCFKSVTGALQDSSVGVVIGYKC